MKRALLALYRLRGPIYYVAAAILIGNALGASILSQESATPIRGALVLGALLVAATCMLLTFRVPKFLPVQPSLTVHPPVRGRWLGMNSPASKVPSHGLRAYGQAYAIDLVHEPSDVPADAIRPAFGGESMRASNAYPAFGQPVLAMIDGTVVKASGWRRDHRARSNWFGLIYLMVEGAIRELGGPGFVVGNHVTIRSDSGICATIAHLQRGTLTVSVGDRVAAGQQIGSCGNSGNSSEPHVHAQLMDRASLWTAQGVPMSFRQIALSEEPELVDALPENDQHMTTRSTESRTSPT